MCRVCAWQVCCAEPSKQLVAGKARSTENTSAPSLTTRDPRRREGVCVCVCVCVCVYIVIAAIQSRGGEVWERVGGKVGGVEYLDRLFRGNDEAFP